MWNRKDIKASGKECFKRNYWLSVLVAFIYDLFFTGTLGSSATRREEITDTVSEQGLDATTLITIIVAVIAIISLIVIIATLIDVFILNPLEVGCQRFFLTNLDRNAALGELSHAYKNNYKNTVLGLFLRNLLISLGTIVIIPGVILSYSYRMVPYILAEDASISGTDALKKSREMMKGHKWNAFVYDLSFIGWFLLSILTLGILYIFYLAPYKKNADAELYRAIKR